MCLPATDGLAVVYVLADEWLTRQQVIGALVGKNRDSLDDVLDNAARVVRSHDPLARAKQVAAMGGETA